MLFYSIGDGVGFQIGGKNTNKLKKKEREKEVFL